jgi:integrase
VKNRQTNQAGYIMRHRGWWVLRYRERVGVGGEMKTVQRARRLAPIDATCKTEAAARKLAGPLLDSLNKTTWSAQPQFVTTLGDFCERVYFPFVEEQKRPSTLRGYRQMWDSYLSKRCASVWLRDVRTHDVQRWLDQIAGEERVAKKDLSKTTRSSKVKTHRLSKTTLKHIKHFLGGVFRHAAQQGYLDEIRADMVTLAAIPAKAEKGKEGTAYSFEEVAVMLKVLFEPAATVVATAAFSGLRHGELLGLEWEAYQPPPNKESLGELSITRSIWRGHVGEPKTEKSKAPVPVIPQLAEYLDGHRMASGNPGTGPIFRNGLGKPLSLDWLYWDHMRDELKKAGVKWRGWHAFRRGLASNLNRLGVDDSVIQGILRHSNVAVTQTHYIKTARPDAVAAMGKLSEALVGVLKRSDGSKVNHSGAPDSNCAPPVLQKGQTSGKIKAQLLVQ